MVFRRARTADYRASVHDIAGFLLKLMNNPELRATMGRAGRERAVERYDYRAVARQLVKILNQLAQEFRIAIIVVTHDEKIIPTFKRIYHIRDGRTYEEAGEGRPL